jgi:hypothetical protein
MAGFDDTKALLHRIQVRLYENHLAGVKGRYTARVLSERSITFEEVCENMGARGQFEGSADAAALNVKAFFEECEFLLCDGWQLKLPGWSVKPHVAGSWDHRDEAGDRVKHPVRFTYRTLPGLRKRAEGVQVEVLGVSRGEGSIDEIRDQATSSVNGKATVGNVIAASGYGLKIGADPAGPYKDKVGAFFVNESEELAAVVAVNGNKQVRIVVPAGLSLEARWTLVIRTQLYAIGSGGFLKEPREVRAGTALTPVLPSASANPPPLPRQDEVMPVTALNDARHYT